MIDEKDVGLFGKGGVDCLEEAVVNGRIRRPDEQVFAGGLLHRGVDARGHRSEVALETNDARVQFSGHMSNEKALVGGTAINADDLRGGLLEFA